MSTEAICTTHSYVSGALFWDFSVGFIFFLFVCFLLGFMTQKSVRFFSAAVCELLQGCDLIAYFSCHNQESVHMYLCIPWRPVSGESFCS